MKRKNLKNQDPLRILLLEDNPNDAELIGFELGESGLEFVSTRVETESAFKKALTEFSPDLILSDYDLPLYSGIEALAETRKRLPDIPFILVTGAVTEDRAIEVLTSGAKDYVLKNRLNRLVPAVERALAESEEHKARRTAEKKLREAHKTLEVKVEERTAELQAEVEAKRKAESLLQRHTERLEILTYTAGRLLESDQPQAIVTELCRRVMTFLDCQAFFNFMVDDDLGCLHLNAYAGIDSQAAEQLKRLDYGAAVCGCVARDGVMMVAENIHLKNDIKTDLVKSFGIRAYACHPLADQGRVIGTLSFATRNRASFSDDDLSMMKTITDQVAVATSRIKMEEELRRLNARLEQRVSERTKELQAVSLYSRSLIEASLDPLVTISPEGKITDVNRATEQVTGRMRLELIGTDFSDYFTRPDSAREGYRKVLSDGHVRDYPLTIRHGSGSMTDVLYNASVYLDQAGQIQGVFAAARDITELKKAEEALRRSHDELELRIDERTQELKERTSQLETANKELESFAYSVSHDLRAPLRAIEGFSAALEKEAGGKLEKEELRKFNTIRDNARRMEHLIEDLLGFSRLGRQAMSLSTVDLQELVKQAWKECLAANPGRRLELKVDPLPAAFGDRSLLRQVVSNLLSNAVKYTRLKKSGGIRVGGEVKNGESVFFVRDNGAGFDMKYYEKLFGVFQRLHGSEFEGTGIGLAIVNRIIQRHGGRVWAEGEVDKGATFYFSLPTISPSR